MEHTHHNRITYRPQYQSDAGIYGDTTPFNSSHIYLFCVAGIVAVSLFFTAGTFLDKGMSTWSNLALAMMAGAPQEETPTPTQAPTPDSVDLVSGLHTGFSAASGLLELMQMVSEGLPEGSRIEFVPVDEYGAYEARYAAQGPDQGMVVLPSFGAEADMRMAEYLQNVFSDEVIMTPDEDMAGKGIIQPVFRTTVGKDYLYVLVPVNQ